MEIYIERKEIEKDRGEERKEIDRQKERKREEKIDIQKK